MPNNPCAIISTYVKDGVDDLARAFVKAKIDVLSTGGTAKFLKEKGIKVQEIADYTTFPEMMGGRVKTLHPLVHGGILARRDKEEDVNSLTDCGGRLIDYAIINLYPFIEKARSLHDNLGELIEFIDVGGPTMIRAAAKNFQFVTVVVDPADYAKVATEVEEKGETSLQLRRYLAVKAFTTVSTYDSVISYVLGMDSGFEIPQAFTVPMNLEKKLRYGENPHQWGAIYSSDPVNGMPIKLNEYQSGSGGKELSYNNMLDALSAIHCANDLSKNCCVIVKHNTPCGAAAKGDQSVSFEKALECDPISAYGGVMAFKSALTMETAKKIIDSKTFLEVLAIPAIEKDVLEFLRKSAKWGPNLRVVEFDAKHMKAGLNIRILSKIALVQSRDDSVVEEDQLECQIGESDDRVKKELIFAFAVAKYAKSNAIVITKDFATIGIGAGQTSRVDAAKLAVEKAGVKANFAVAASDAFFPFTDGLEVLAKAGIKAVIHPGGSIRDNDIIKCAGKNGIALYKTGIRHFLH